MGKKSAALSAIAFAIAAGVPLMAASQVNRCVIDGKTTYQEKPCEKGAGAEVKIYTPSTTNFTPSPEIERLTKNVDRLSKNMLDAQKVYSDLVAKHCAGKSIDTPVIGQTQDDFACIARYRHPESINRTIGPGGESQQRVYRDHGRTTYIYFTKGVLTAMQGEIF